MMCNDKLDINLLNRNELNIYYEKIKGRVRCIAFGTIAIGFILIVAFILIILLLDGLNDGFESVLISASISILLGVFLVCGIGFESTSLILIYIIGTSCLLIFYLYKGILYIFRVIELNYSSSHDPKHNHIRRNLRSGNETTPEIVHNEEGETEKPGLTQNQIIFLSIGLVNFLILIIHLVFIIIVSKFIVELKRKRIQRVRIRRPDEAVVQVLQRRPEVSTPDENVVRQNSE